MRNLLNQRERQFLSPLSCFSDTAVRRRPDSRINSGYRQSFSIDSDRIINSHAYTRYIDKTQVFSLINNDHLTHRVLHVQLVSRIARTIGRFLGLNEDLIEAASLGHDLGHPPFGHDGERFLSKLTLAHGAGYFHHNLQSLEFLENIERNGKGWNLALQTLDAILCHNGEVHVTALKPSREKSFTDLDREQLDMKTKQFPDPVPMTMEGCVVRMADTISYVGRDMEDAVRLKLINRQEIPKKSARLLGETNGTIVFNLVTDLIHTSLGQPHIAFSSDVSEALKCLRDFNYERIYANPAIKEHLMPIKEIYSYLFEKYLEDLDKKRFSSDAFKKFYLGLSNAYKERLSHAELVRDYLSGMTDSFFIRQAPETMRPASIIK